MLHIITSLFHQFPQEVNQQGKRGTVCHVRIGSPIKPYIQKCE